MNYTMKNGNDEMYSLAGVFFIYFSFKFSHFLLTCTKWVEHEYEISSLVHTNNPR